MYYYTQIKHSYFQNHIILAINISSLCQFEVLKQYFLHLGRKYRHIYVLLHQTKKHHYVRCRIDHVYDPGHQSCHAHDARISLLLRRIRL